MLPKPESQLLRIRRKLAIGDALAATVVAEKLWQQGHRVIFQCEPFLHELIERTPFILRCEPTNTQTPDVNLDGVYEKDPNRTRRHFSEMFLAAACFQLRHRGITVWPPTNCNPILIIMPHERRAKEKAIGPLPRPWTFVTPRSQFWTGRTVRDETWMRVAGLLPGTKFWLGIHAAAPPGFLWLQCPKLIDLAASLSCADLMISVDTGPLHIAAALGIPLLAILQSSSPELHISDQRDFEMVAPALDCLNCQRHICPIKQYEPPCQEIPHELIADAALRRLDGQNRLGVSAIIPTYRAPAERLNRCLAAVLPQVDEVVITREAGSILPEGLLSDRKIRHVLKRESRIGFGRNVNFGARHSSRQYLLILNDDVYLAGDAVQRMLEVMKPGVGLVGQLLRYPDGRIYHGGVARAPGTLDWGHVDHGKYVESITSPCEMEQVTGASILVRRKAFYEAGAFDENFFLYCEDNDLCMKIRQLGYRVWYTPLAAGVHEGSATSRQLPNYTQAMQASQRYFHEKWDWYLKKNLHKPLGDFNG